MILTVFSKGTMTNFSKYMILIFSENPDKLVPFYQDLLGLKLLSKLDIPGDYGYTFEINSEMKLWLGKHSEIHGTSQEPFRHLFNLYPTEGVEQWYQKLVAAKVAIVAKPFLAPFSTPEKQIWFCTFQDPEGNCWQMVGKK